MKHKLYMSGREIRQRGPVDLSNTNASITPSDLEAIGFGGFGAMDSALVGPAMQGGTINREFLRHQLAGVIRTATRVRVLDEITGVVTAGNWHDEDVAVNVATAVGKAELYGDYANIPLANYVHDTEARGIVRFEQGFHVGRLEEARQGAYGYDAAAEKRNAATESLEESRERLGWYGFTAPNSRVFGLLNDPNLPAYETGSDWTTGSFADITGDIADMFANVETSSGGRVNSETAVTLVLPMGYRRYMNVSNDTARGDTVQEWINANYPNARIIYAPEFVGANGGANVAYLFADNVDAEDDATSATILQIVPVRYQVLGSENQIKGYLEDATNATAGVIVARPWALTRMTGI